MTSVQKIDSGINGNEQCKHKHSTLIRIAISCSCEHVKVQYQLKVFTALH